MVCASLNEISFNCQNTQHFMYQEIKVKLFLIKRLTYALAYDIMNIVKVKIGIKLRIFNLVISAKLQHKATAK